MTDSVVTGLWSPEWIQELRWDGCVLKSLISADKPNGDRIVDAFFRIVKPYSYPSVIEHIQAGKSLFFEDVGCTTDGPADEYVALIDTSNRRKKLVGKGIFLKLVANLAQDFLDKGLFCEDAEENRNGTEACIGQEMDDSNEEEFLDVDYLFDEEQPQLNGISRSDILTSIKAVNDVNQVRKQCVKHPCIVCVIR